MECQCYYGFFFEILWDKKVGFSINKSLLGVMDKKLWLLRDDSL